MAASERYLLQDTRTERALATRLELARTPWTRLRGLLGRSGLGDGEGIWLEPSSSIHTAFMRFSIDVLFVDRDHRGLRCVHALRPVRVAVARGTRSIVELPAGTLRDTDTHVGDVLEMRPAEPEPT